MTRPTSEVLTDALNGRVICNIGQLSHETKLALEREIRAGRLAKWRGYWYPAPGMLWGLGPPKMCYGLPRIKEYYERNKP